MKKLIVLIVALLVVSCGPVLNGGTGNGASRPFVVTVHNTTKLTIDVGIGVSTDGYATSGTFLPIQPLGSRSYYCVPGTPDSVYLRNPLSWSVPGFFWYDQVYRQPTDYPANATGLDVWYP